MSLRRILSYVLLGAMLATPMVYSSPQQGVQKKGKHKGGSKGGGKRGGGAPTKKGGGGK